MEEVAAKLVQTANTAVWLYVFLPCVLFGGVYLTIRCRAVQITRFGWIMRRVLRSFAGRRPAGRGAVTPAQAVSTALAATVGTGNIVGASQAVAMGGCGALFWLWAASLLSMIIKYSEITLSIRFRERNAAGEWVGGPMYCARNALGPGWRGVGALFCVFAAAASFGIGSMAQTNAISSAVCTAVCSVFPAADLYLPVARAACGLLAALLAAGVLSGGIRRVGAAAERMIPAMGALYLFLSFLVIACNARRLPFVLGRVISDAFTPDAALGAAGGVGMRQAIVWGVRRCAFSNEAGLGSASVAHAAAETDSAAGQGIFGVFEVFADTVLICTATALAILCSGVEIPFGTMPGMELAAAAFASVFGAQAASWLLAVCMALFAFSTILGWSVCGGRCIEYLFGARGAKVYRAAFLLAAALGAAVPTEAVWMFCDLCNGLMAIPNFLVLFALSGETARLTAAFFFPASETASCSRRMQK